MEEEGKIMKGRVKTEKKTEKYLRERKKGQRTAREKGER